MPRGIYTKECTGAFHGPNTPQDHQKLVLHTFLTSPFKGLLLFHKLGSGKTCTSIYIADALLKNKMVSKVYIFTPGSLRESWIKEYCKVCGASSEQMKQKYVFVTYNYSSFKQLPSTLNKCLVIIDECHNFINTVKNKSDSAYDTYQLINKSSCRVLLLSGTPIYDNLYEFPILAQLLKPGVFPNILGDKDRGNSVSRTASPFMDNFIENKTTGAVTAVNPDKFKKDLSGIISFFPGAGAEFYPRVIVHPIQKVPMSSQERFKKLLKTMDEEKILIAIGPPRPGEKNYAVKQMRYMLATKHVASRRISNFQYPKHIEDLYTAYTTALQEKDLVAAQEALSKIPDDELESKDSKGWVSHKYFAKGELAQYSPKFTKIITNILNNYNAKHMIFSFLKSKGGVNLLSAILEMCGVPTVVFSGDMSDAKRQKILATFNDVKNRYGGVIKVILITDAGAEGINLLETQHVHLMDSDPREVKLQQVIGRAVRFKSHINMPEENRVVNVWRYWSVSPQTTEAIGIDEMLYIKGQKQITKLNTFMDMLINASIERNV